MQSNNLLFGHLTAAGIQKPLLLRDKHTQITRYANQQATTELPSISPIEWLVYRPLRVVKLTNQHPE